MRLFFVLLAAVSCTNGTGCNYAEQFELTCTATSLKLRTKKSTEVAEVCRTVFESSAELYDIYLMVGSDGPENECRLGLETEPLAGREKTFLYEDSTCIEQNESQFESKIYVKKMWRDDEGQDASILIESAIPISCSAENFFVSTTAAIASQGNIMASLQGDIKPTNPKLEIYGRNENNEWVSQSTIIVGLEYTLVISLGELLTPLLDLRVRACKIGTMEIIANSHVLPNFDDMVSLVSHVPSGVAVGETALGIDFKAFLLNSASNGEMNIECEMTMVGAARESETTEQLIMTTPQSFE